MILSSNGQNIYPEEIEDKVNNLPGVVESLVVGRQGKIVALVYPDEKYDLQDKSMDELMNENLAKLNAMLPTYSKAMRIWRQPVLWAAMRAFWTSPSTTNN